MKLKIYILELKDYFFDEILSMGIGWVAGLLAVQLVSKFFLKRSWNNAWGLFSKKVVVAEATFSIGEWLISAVIGFMVMKLVNKLFSRISKKLRSSLDEELKEKQMF